MSELQRVLEYMDDLPTILQAGSLRNEDRILCFIINNRLNQAINLENRNYKTMTDLVGESVVAVREMRYDVERMVRKSYSKIPIMDSILFYDAIVELGKIDLDGYQSCVSYLSDLAIASHAVIKTNSAMSKEVKLVFNTLIYLSVSALNLFNNTRGLPPEKKGIEISFDRKRKQEVGARRA